MVTFRHDRTECQCVDDEVNSRVLCLDRGEAGRVYVYLSANDVKEAAGQFSRYGVLERASYLAQMTSGSTRWNSSATWAAMLEKMLEAGFADPAKEIAAWLLALQHCSKRLGEELLKTPGRRGTTAAILTAGRQRARMRISSVIRRYGNVGEVGQCRSLQLFAEGPLGGECNYLM